MAKIDRFEDLECWKTARELVNYVFDLCEKPGLNKDFDTKSQLKRAAVSTMNNIAEGFGRHSKKEFIRYLEISQSSGLEVRSMAYILLDRKYTTAEELNILNQKANSLVNLTNGLVRYLKTKINNP